MRICKIDGCFIKHWAGGYCRAHYRQYIKWGYTWDIGTKMGNWCGTGDYKHLRKKGIDHPAYKNGSGKYDIRNRIFALQLLGNKCQGCGNEQDLNLHHKDGNPLNNDHSNWQILCRKCHLSLHGRYFGMLPEQKKKAMKEYRCKYYKEKLAPRTWVHNIPIGYVRAKDACEIAGISREWLNIKKDLFGAIPMSKYVDGSKIRVYEIAKLKSYKKNII